MTRPSKSSEPRKSEVTTLSARFFQNEMELLREAAERRGWSLAQLIQIAAKEKAVQINNVSGKAVTAVRDVARRVAQQLFAARIEGLRDEDGRDIDDWENLVTNGDTHKPIVSRLDETAGDDFCKIVRLLGTELGDVLEVEFRQITGRGSLSDLVDPAAPFSGNFTSQAIDSLGKTESRS